MKTINENIETPALSCKVGRAYQIMLGQLDETLKDANLQISTSEYLVLRAIFSKPGAQQCEIAEMVGKDKAAICRCVAGLEHKKLVEIECVSHKCLRVYPSAGALELKSGIMGVAAKRHQALAQMTTPAELDIFNRILDKIINSK